MVRAKVMVEVMGSISNIGLGLGFRVAVRVRVKGFGLAC